MTTRDKLEYQKRLRFLREARAKTASEQLKLAKAAEESDLTKRMVTLGDKENRVPARDQTPKAYNEVPKTRETSRVKKPVEAGDEGDNVLDIDLSDLNYAKISEQKRFYVKRVGREERNEPYSGPEMDKLDIEPQFYSDEAEAGTVADLLIDLDPHGMEDFYVANLEDEPVDSDDDDFLNSLREATPPQEDADQSLARMKKRKKATRTKSMKRKSHAKINESNLAAVLRECGCEMESPFDAPEDEPQGYMLKQSLEKIGSQATDLSNLANHDDDPEPWVEFKVTSAAENIDAVHDYIKYGRKHRSDMGGHEDMHSNDDMMNEKNLHRLIRKLVREQTGPSLTSRPTSASTTDTSLPPAIEAISASATPAASTPPVATPDRVQRAVQACKSLFDPNTPRSLINHLTRLLRGLQTRNPTVANYELNSHNAHMHLTYNVRALDIIFVYQGVPGRSDGQATRLFDDSAFGPRYHVVINGIRDALTIPGVNRIRTDPDGERHITLLDWPRDITRINPRLMADMIARLQRAIAIINAENSTTPNICDLISQIPMAAELSYYDSATSSRPIVTEKKIKFNKNNKRLNENKKKVSLKTILEQTDDGPTEFDYAMGMGATGFASPDASVPAAPAAVPTVSAPTAAATTARRGARRAPVTDVTQAINLIFDPNTPRSFINHLTRMLRGIQQNNATVADYELRANRASVTFVLNRYIPLIRAQRTDLAPVLDELVNQINTFNRPELPQTLAQITNRQQAIRKITTLIEWLNGNRNRVLVPTPTPTPERVPAPTPTPEPTPTTNPEEDAAYEEANRALATLQQEIAAYLRSIMSGETDLSDVDNREAYFERLNAFSSRRNGLMNTIYSHLSRVTPDRAAAAIERHERRIESMLNNIGANPSNVQLYYENKNKTYKNVSEMKKNFFKNLINELKEGNSLLKEFSGFELENVLNALSRAPAGSARAARLLSTLETTLAQNPTVASRIAQLSPEVLSRFPSLARAVSAAETALTSGTSLATTAAGAGGTGAGAGGAGVGAAAGETALLGAGETAATTAAGTGEVAGLLGSGETAAGLLTAGETTALAAPTAAVPAPAAAATPWLPVLGAGIAGYGLGTLGVGTYGAITGRGTDTAEIYGVPVGLSVRPDTTLQPQNLTFAARAASRLLQNERSALQSIRNALNVGASPAFSGITNPYSRSLSAIANEIDPARGLPRD